MKKIIFFLTGLVAWSVVSCSDMLDVDESRNLSGDAAIAKKTDSLFYAWGIMQAMQEAADIYVVQNEMRGDLVDLTSASSIHLRALANFSADASNKYDSAYVYYKVINNCNNFLAHRDTSLYDASDNVTLEEYASVLSFRAWAYLQLARQYGKVKFFTEPLTSISEINQKSRELPEIDIQAIVSQLAPDLEQFSATPAPNYADINCGQTNLGTSKTAYSHNLYIPVDIILGEMYLETGQWMKAAKHYYDYIYAHQLLVPRERASAGMMRWLELHPDLSLPVDFNYIDNFRTVTQWLTSTSAAARFLGKGNGQTSAVISYIPMAVNRLMGKTTELPELFGFDYYATSRGDQHVLAQMVPSNAYYALADSSEYYYVPNVTNVTSYSSYKYGDTRRFAREEEVEVGDTARYYPTLYQDGNVVLYRTTTLWLHLAEALNRAGYPDAAFAILKDGISTQLSNYVVSTDTVTGSQVGYIQPATIALFRDSSSVVPFLSRGADVFVPEGTARCYGIHGHGCSDQDGIDGVRSLYQMSTVVGAKLSALERELGIQPQGTLADTINAVEDLLCDEYAMEFAFEGTRFSDLARMARHKNEAGLYGAAFGSLWLSRKLAFKQPVVDLTNTDNWYLPIR